MSTRVVDLKCRILVMISGLKEIDPPSADSVDKPVFLRDPSGPAPRQNMPERFRFADSAERIVEHGLH